jgi:hypothetical protein
MARVARENPEARVLVRAVRFADRANWHIGEPTPVERLQWHDLQAGGVTAMGEALELVADQLASPPMEERALPPVLVLISDGQPTDDFDTGLARLLRQPWAQKAVRLAIAVGGAAAVHRPGIQCVRAAPGPILPLTPPPPAGQQRHRPGPVHPVGLHRCGGRRLHARQPG